MKKAKPIYDVVGAVIKKRGKFLICKRMENDDFPSLWEFPGGRVEEGEGNLTALKRELKEELDVEIEIKDLIGIFEDEIPKMKIKIYLYGATIRRGKPKCVECEDFMWASLARMKKISLAPADRKILRHFLRKGR